MIERVLEYKKLCEVLMSHNFSPGLASETALKAVYGVSIRHSDEEAVPRGKAQEETPDNESKWIKRQLHIPRDSISVTELLQTLRVFRAHWETLSTDMDRINWLRWLVQS